MCKYWKYEKGRRGIIIGVMRRDYDGKWGFHKDTSEYKIYRLYRLQLNLILEVT